MPGTVRVLSWPRRRRGICPDRIAERVIVTSPVKACRDPKDDKLLEVGVNGKADLIVTGDKDLLTLHPFRRVKISLPGNTSTDDLPNSGACRGCR